MKKKLTVGDTGDCLGPDKVSMVSMVGLIDCPRDDSNIDTSSSSSSSSYELFTISFLSDLVAVYFDIHID